jgi:uncharacterized membrane protein
VKPERLAALADGVFAIVLTLLVLELKVPHLAEPVTDTTIWHELASQSATWLGFVLSFAFLYQIWRAHHFFMSVLAKSLDTVLLNWNGWHLFFIAVIPFSAHLLGSYPLSPLAICIYALNVFLISITLHGMRRYIITSDKVENIPWSRREEWSANIRVANPFVGSLLAIAQAWSYPKVSLGLFAFGIFFNMTTFSVRSIYRMLTLFGVNVPPVENGR